MQATENNILADMEVGRNKGVESRGVYGDTGRGNNRRTPPMKQKDIREYIRGVMVKNIDNERIDPYEVADELCDNLRSLIQAEKKEDTDPLGCENIMGWNEALDRVLEMLT